MTLLGCVSRLDQVESGEAVAEAHAASPHDHGASDDARIDALYRAQSPRLFRVLMRRLANREDAIDLVQDVFSRFVRLGAVRRAEIERPEALLTTIAKNLLRDRAKHRARQSQDFHQAADDDLLAGTDQVRLLESRDMLRRLEAAMVKMKPKTREIFMAHRIDGLSYADIAARTGLSVKGVEKQMSRAIEHIDRHLERR